MRLKDLKIERAELKIKLAELDTEIAKKTSKVAVICESNTAHGKGCGAGFYIEDLVYIQTHWYENPYGCTGEINGTKEKGSLNALSVGTGIDFSIDRILQS